MTELEMETAINRYVIVFAVSFAHVAVGSLDQFIDHNIKGHGHISQQSRNAGLVICDFLGVFLPLFDLFQIWRRLKNPVVIKQLATRHAFAALSIVFTFLFMTHLK